MNQEVYGFSLSKNEWSSPLGLYFKNATDGEPSNSKTEVSISYDEAFLNINFHCYESNFIQQNNLTVHNSELYNQEVFEVFISKGKEDPKEYFEIEINPNNALWIGEINNPTLGEETQSLKRMIAYEESNIRHQVYQLENSWKGRLSIPWTLIGKSDSGAYRINFYRIRLIQSQSDSDWKCDSKNCEFLCWSPTLSGKTPAFHRPKRFGHMKLLN
jgi:hypothetical protein